MTVTARPASTVCLLRDGASGIEVLMTRRSEAVRVMAGVWVFPGGAVAAEDHTAASVVTGPADDLAWRAAALRELAEETGILLTTGGVVVERPGPDVFATAVSRRLQLDGDALGYFANWITPESLPVRYDTRFFAAVADADPVIDHAEVVDAEWVAPAAALERAGNGWSVAFPTQRTLQRLASFPDAVELMVTIAGLASVPPIQPRVVLVDGAPVVLMPDDPGFDEAIDATIEVRNEDLLPGGAVTER